MYRLHNNMQRNASHTDNHSSDMGAGEGLLVPPESRDGEDDDFLGGGGGGGEQQGGG